MPNNKPSEQKTKRYILNASLIPFFGKTPLGKITSHDIERYKAHAVKDGVSRKTINNRLTVLRKCMTTAYDWLELPGTPPKFVWLKCPPHAMDYLSPDECELLLAHADGVIREMLLTALRTGMRQGELKGLQWSSIDWCERRSGSAQRWRSEIFRHDICRRIGRTLPSTSWWQSAAGWQALSTP